jgi:NADH:ubiquinone oxidoreductase subunit C
MTDTTMQFESISERLGIAVPWVERGGARWLTASPESVRELVLAMNEAHARFITITAFQLSGDEGFRLDYHWDLDGQLLGVSFHLAGRSIESIVDICEAADWAEREVHEGFAIDFQGRAYEPLELRQGDTPGVNLREVKQ